MARSAIENAEEFGRHVRGGGWELGLLVACSVEPGPAIDDRGKLSIRAFAQRARVSPPTVSDHLEAWERAAAKRIVPRASSLEPADATDTRYLPEGYEWNDYHSPKNRSGKSAAFAAAEIERHGPSKVIEELTPRLRRELTDALVEREPELATRAMVRAERMPQRSIDPREVGRRAGESMGRAIGAHTDQATEYLLGAARDLAAAEVARREFGIEDPEAEAAALERIDRYREVYGNGRARWSQGDRTFLDEMGVTV